MTGGANKRDAATLSLVRRRRPASGVRGGGEEFRRTRCGFLQRVPAVEGPLLLVAQVGAVLQQPVGDPALADPWKAARH